MKKGIHICYTMRIFILSLTFMVCAAAIPQPSMAKATLADTKLLDQKAERIIKKALLLQRIDTLEAEEADKICNFVLDYEKTEWIKTQVYKTPFHDDVALTLHNIAALYQLCHAPMAQKYLQSILKIKQKIYSTQSEEAASAHDALGDYQRLYIMGFKKAIAHYEEAKRIRIKLYGNNDPRITKNYNSLAITIFYHKNEKTYAEKLLADSIAIRETSLANEGYPSYRAHIDAGIYYAITQAYEKAISHLETALNTFKGGRNNEDITILSELGIIYLNKNDLKMSLKYAKAAYDKGKILYEKRQTPDFLQTIVELLDVYEVAGDKKSANQLKTELKKVKNQLLNELK